MCCCCQSFILKYFYSVLTALATYFLTKELWSSGAGLLAACFIAIVPGYISRSVAGSYDNEGIAIFALMFTYFLWVKSVKTGSMFWATLTALSYFYMVIVNLREKRHRYFITTVDFLGFCMGWICVHYKLDPASRIRTAAHGAIL